MDILQKYIKSSHSSVGCLSCQLYPSQTLFTALTVIESDLICMYHTKTYMSIFIYVNKYRKKYIFHTQSYQCLAFISERSIWAIQFQFSVFSNTIDSWTFQSLEFQTEQALSGGTNKSSSHIIFSFSHLILIPYQVPIFPFASFLVFFTFCNDLPCNSKFPSRAWHFFFQQSRCQL